MSLAQGGIAGWLVERAGMVCHIVRWGFREVWCLVAK